MDIPAHLVQHVAARHGVSSASGSASAWPPGCPGLALSFILGILSAGRRGAPFQYNWVSNNQSGGPAACALCRRSAVCWAALAVGDARRFVRLFGMCWFDSSAIGSGGLLHRRPLSWRPAGRTSGTCAAPTQLLSHTSTRQLWHAHASGALRRRVFCAGVQRAAGAPLAAGRARRHPGPDRLDVRRACGARAVGSHCLAGAAPRGSACQKALAACTGQPCPACLRERRR